jgi:hypothetical protein
MNWDDVLFCNLFLHCNFETYLNLSKTCKKANRVGKIVREEWLLKNLIKNNLSGNKKFDKIIFSYYIGKNGKIFPHSYFYYYKNPVNSIYSRKILYKEGVMYSNIGYDINNKICESYIF